MESNSMVNRSQSDNEYIKIIKKIKDTEESEAGSDLKQDNVYIDISDIIENGSNARKQKPVSYTNIVSYIEKELVDIHHKHSFFNTTEKQQYDSLDSKIKNMYIDVKELVLPTLSIADQISELERIDKAISEGVLNKEHMQIVIEEIYGLKSILDKNNKGAKGMIGMDNSIESLRSQRLSDIISKIG